MLRVLIFDLGQTLIDAANQPFPHVKEALTAISTFTAEDGKRLRSCLVSDFTMPSPPVTPAKVTALFNQYLAILDATGLRPFFEPVKKRITLSTHAGVGKPDRRIFEKALQRLGASTVPLEECLLVTENGEHIQKARDQLHMQTLQFGVDFQDWLEAPTLIAQRVAPSHFAQPHEQVWRTVPVPGFEDLEDVHVAVSVKGNMSRKKKNDTKKNAEPGQPSEKDIAEASSYMRSLAAHDQIAGRPGKPATGATHEIETDEKGNRKLVRKRFSAI